MQNANEVTPLHTVGEIAAHLTRALGDYVPTDRVSRALRRLIGLGQIQEQKVGRQVVLMDSDLPVVESWFGVTAEMSKAAGAS